MNTLPIHSSKEYCTLGITRGIIKLFGDDFVRRQALLLSARLTHFAQSSKIGTVTRGFDARLANRPFLVFDFRALWRSGLSTRVPESQKLKMVG